jgi:hypothetical protein
MAELFTPPDGYSISPFTRAFFSDGSMGYETRVFTLIEGRLVSAPVVILDSEIARFVNEGRSLQDFVNVKLEVAGLACQGRCANAEAGQHA